LKGTLCIGIEEMNLKAHNKKSKTVRVFIFLSPALSQTIPYRYCNFIDEKGWSVGVW